MRALLAFCALCALISVAYADPFPIGVSFSGGGIRATIGTLAAVNQMLPDLQGIVPRVQDPKKGAGLRPDSLTKIRSLGATSGGTWGLSLQYINDRATGKRTPGVISKVRELLKKDNSKWGPEGDLFDMNAKRFNEEWSDRVCFSLYKPFENGMNEQEGNFLRGKTKALPAPPIPPPREQAPIPYRMCTWLWQYRGIDQEIQANAKESGRANYLAFNAYIVKDKHVVLPGQVAELRSSDNDVPDFFIRYNLAEDSFQLCRAADCLNPQPAQVFVAKNGITEKTLQVKSREEAQWVLNPISDLSKWERLDTRRSGTILDLLGFASAAWTSNMVPAIARASIALCAIRVGGSREMVPIILTDAGVFQNNPFNILGEQLVVSFDFSDITSRGTWVPEISGPLRIANPDIHYETEVVPMTAQSADPDIKFAIHRFRVGDGRTERVVFQVPGRFFDNPTSYRDYPTMVGKLGADVNRYAVSKMDAYYAGLKDFYKKIAGDLRARIALEAGRLIAQTEPDRAAHPKLPSGPAADREVKRGPSLAPATAPGPAALLPSNAKSQF